MMLQVHPSVRDECCRIWVPGQLLLPGTGTGRGRLVSQLGGTGQSAAQGLHQREMAKAVEAFALFS
jgi:hypothetical protein